MSSTTRMCSSDAFSASAVARTASTTACRAASVSTSCVLARRARRLRGHACVLAGDPRALSGLSQPISLLSSGFERLAMMITKVTRFLSESPETVPPLACEPPRPCGLSPAHGPRRYYRVRSRITYCQITGSCARWLSRTVRNICVSATRPTHGQPVRSVSRQHSGYVHLWHTLRGDRRVRRASKRASSDCASSGD